MRTRAIFQTLMALDECEEKSEILAEFESLLVHLNFEYYGVFGKVDIGSSHLNQSLAGYWPTDWLHTFTEKKHYAADPSLRYLSVSTGGFRWSEALQFFAKDPNYRKMARVLADAERFGLLDGYTFPVFGRSGLAGFLSVSGRTQDMSTAEVTLFESLAKKLLFKLQDLNRRNVPIPAQQPESGIAVTRRELEALKYIAEGMTSNEISKIMEISSHTVDWYLNGLQTKLDARNRQHAVAIAFRTGLIS